MKKIMMALGLVALAAGCASQYKNDGGEAKLCPTIVRDIAYEKYDIKSTPVESVDNRVAIGPIVFGGIAGHIADDAPGGWFDRRVVQVAKNGAYAAACEAANCDALVGSRYTVDYTNYFLWQEVTVRVKGYPATLTGVEFHKANLDCCCGKK